MPLIIRISAYEWMKEGWEYLDSYLFIKREAEKLGVDAIHVSSGGNIEKPDNIY
ncbi:MAG: hypothetical protein R2837_08665 [Aliarcobacter sp.]